MAEVKSTPFYLTAKKLKVAGTLKYAGVTSDFDKSIASMLQVTLHPLHSLKRGVYLKDASFSLVGQLAGSDTDKIKECTKRDGIWFTHELTITFPKKETLAPIAAGASQKLQVIPTDVYIRQLIENLNQSCVRFAHTEQELVIRVKAELKSQGILAVDFTTDPDSIFLIFLYADD